MRLRFRGRAKVLASALAAALASGCSDGGVATNQGYAPIQPIAFSHAVHAGDRQIECLYCHAGAESSRHAGVPPASACMGCHAQVKADSPEVKKVAEAVGQDRPIEWIKVHRLPDHAYFNHSSHVVAGVKCQACHGPVETMVRVEQVERMTMGWCLECHRSTSGSTAPALPPSDCSACHR